MIDYATRRSKEIKPFKRYKWGIDIEKKKDNTMGRYGKKNHAASLKNEISRSIIGRTVMLKIKAIYFFYFFFLGGIL